MPMKLNQDLLPEIDTKWNGAEGDGKHQQHPTSNSKSFREADTPKHCNKGSKASSGSAIQSFQAHQPYPNSHHPFMNNRESHMQHMTNNYYGHYHPSGPNQGAMVSPGGYNNYHHGSHYYGQQHQHPDKSIRSGFSSYGNHHGPLQYNRGFSPYSGLNAGTVYHNTNTHGSYQNQKSDMNMEFSRAVSSSFSENTAGPLKPAPSMQNSLLDNHDDVSIGAESDSSWRQGLNQVASIEEDKFEARQGATTPVDKICPTLSSDASNDTLKDKRRTLFPIPSLDEPLDISHDKNGLGDLKLCSTGSSEFLFSKEPKRERHSRERNITPTMYLGKLSMREQRDAPPTKKSRSSSITDERELYSAFSIESVGSFAKRGMKYHQDERRKVFLSESTDDAEQDEVGRTLTSTMPSWDITGQDSFGGGFSVANADDVLGKSFSFSNDDEFTSANQEKKNVETSDLEGIDPIEGLNSVDKFESSAKSSSREAVARSKSTSDSWESHAPSKGETYPMDSQPNSSNMAHSYSQHAASANYGMPPLYPDNRHLYHSNGPYGGHHHHPQQMLPPSFRPPPPGMAGPPLTRTAPPPVYMMPSPHTGPSGVHGVQSSIKIQKSGTFNWSKADDDRLQDILKRFKNPKDWDAIAKEIGGGRTAKECNERWIRYLKPGVRKGQWQDHEDAIVIEAVTTCKEQPFTRWSDLAQKLPGRVGKQIRDRWVNHLNPNINHMPFTKEDDMKLWEGHKQLGKRWVEISTKFFDSSRSENHIKNRWYSASFKKFVANEFGPDAYGSDKPEKKSSKLKKPRKEEI